MRRVFAAQHALTRGSVEPSLAERKERLEKLRDMVRANEAAYVAAISEDFGNRSADETRLLEVTLVLNGIRHARKHLKGWMRPSRRHVDIAFQPARAWVRHEPLGLVGIIAPWNYPLFLSLGPLVDILAAGNRAMIKPSELTPRFSELLAQTIARTFSEDEVHVVTGGAEVAQAFSGLPFDHLIFTGSTGVGRKVMQAAAENLTPVTLELGGKSPAILCEDYNLQKAARSIAFGKFLNAGQTCIAPDYALVPRRNVDEFATSVIAHARRSYPDIAQNPDYTSIVSDRHYRRLVEAVDQAREAGATVLSAGEIRDSNGRKIAPTVVIDAPADGVLMREEIFGPILPVIGYDDLDEALAFVSGRDRPLALYAFTTRKETQEKILGRAISGGVTLNGTLLHVAQDDMAFGGIGPSGMGGYHGQEGFRRFSHARSVLRIGFINVFEKLGPPWGPLARRVASVLSRRS
ncbi:coniferyl aldehyde dehydrogenase [Paracoccus sp. 11-3]|uniref:Aldehyde dehydrogenase n=2 Tax=Paracoccus amoyensis TaxID=2760093 RepID=A0A926GK75_9RHOB|nr:coniferyl aldehyde dehydrogenase [Paracoccus amoyensis]